MDIIFLKIMITWKFLFLNFVEPIRPNNHDSLTIIRTKIDMVFSMLFACRRIYINWFLESALCLTVSLDNFLDAEVDLSQVLVNFLLSNFCFPQFLDDIQVIRTHLNITIYEKLIEARIRGGCCISSTSMVNIIIQLIARQCILTINRENSQD